VTCWTPNGGGREEEQEREMKRDNGSHVKKKEGKEGRREGGP